MKLHTPTLRQLVFGPRRKCPHCNATAQCQLAFGAQPGRNRYRVECTSLDCGFSVLIEEGPKGGLYVVREAEAKTDADYQQDMRTAQKCIVPSCKGHRGRSGLCPNHKRKWKVGNPHMTLDEFVKQVA